MERLLCRRSFVDSSGPATTRSQEENLVSERHPVVGTWSVSVTIPGGPAGMVNLATLSLDGGVVVAFPSPTPSPPGSTHRLEYWTTALGRWAPTGDQTAKMSFRSLGTDENGNAIGAHAISASATADARGESWSGPFTITITGPDGRTLASLSGTVNATRLSADG